MSGSAATQLRWGGRIYPEYALIVFDWNDEKSINKNQRYRKKSIFWFIWHVTSHTRIGLPTGRYKNQKSKISQKLNIWFIWYVHHTHHTHTHGSRPDCICWRRLSISYNQFCTVQSSPWSVATLRLAPPACRIMLFFGPAAHSHVVNQLYLSNQVRVRLTVYWLFELCTILCVCVVFRYSTYWTDVQLSCHNKRILLLLCPAPTRRGH